MCERDHIPSPLQPPPERGPFGVKRLELSKAHTDTSSTQERELHHPTRKSQATAQLQALKASPATLL